MWGVTHSSECQELMCEDYYESTYKLHLQSYCKQMVE